MRSELLSILVAYNKVAKETDYSGYQEIESKAEEVMDIIRERISNTVFQNFNGTEFTIFIIEKALAKADVQTNETYLKTLISELRKFHETLHYYVDRKRSDGLYKWFFGKHRKTN